MSLEAVIAGSRAVFIIVLYFIFSFGPGFILGVILANRFGGAKKEPLRRKKHREMIKIASAHNSQWHPSHERWKK